MKIGKLIDKKVLSIEWTWTCSTFSQVKFTAFFSLYSFTLFSKYFLWYCILLSVSRSRCLSFLFAIQIQILFHWFFLFSLYLFSSSSSNRRLLYIFAVIRKKFFNCFLPDSMQKKVYHAFKLGNGIYHWGTYI